MSKNVLGKGLDALIPDISKIISSDPSTGAQKMLLMGQIVQNPSQPRKSFVVEKLEELADSIRQKGILQPIVVREKGAQYEIVCGERRYRAAIQAGLKELPVIVRNLTDSEALQVSLIENLQREDLSPLEEAEALQRLASQYTITHDEIARLLGKSRSVITNTIRLLKLPDKIKRLVSEGRISRGHAISILMADTELKMIEMADQVIQRGITVRETEDLLEKTVARRPKGKPDPNILAIEEELQRDLGTKIRIITSPRSSSKKGKIEIYFYSDSDFDRVISKITQQ